MSTQFTVTFVNQPPTASQAALVPLIGQSILAAGTWLNSFVKGWGTIDVKVNSSRLKTVATVFHARTRYLVMGKSGLQLEMNVFYGYMSMISSALLFACFDEEETLGSPS